MEPEDAITTTENVLRDLIDDVLAKKYGAEWIAKCVDDRTREGWLERRAEEKSRQGERGRWGRAHGHAPLRERRGAWLAEAAA